VTIHFWTLPGPASFLERAAAALRDGRSLLLLCPNTTTPENPFGPLEDQIRVDRTSHALGTHWLPEGLTEDADLSAALVAAALAKELGFPPAPIGGADGHSLARAPGAESMTVLIDARHLSAAAQEALSTLATQVAASMKAVTGWRRFALAIATIPSAAHHPPQSDTALAVEWWWGVVRPLDVELALDDIPTLDRCMTRAAIELAAWDVDLARQIATRWSGTLGVLDTALDALLEDVDADELPTNLPGGRAPKRPPAALVSHWRSGIVQSWEGSVRWHLTAERLRDDTTPRRLTWLAQVKELFPVIEIERTRLSAWLAEEAIRVGGSSALRVDGEPIDITDLEIGQIIRYLGLHTVVRLPRGRMELIRTLRDLRNALAHRAPVDLKSVLELRKQVESDRGLG
jgi:hypothetical protein